MGICEGRVIELVSPGDPMVLRIGATRVGLSRQLARQVAINPESNLASVGDEEQGLVAATAVL